MKSWLLSLSHPFSALLRIKKHMTAYRTKNISVITQEYIFFSSFVLFFLFFSMFVMVTYGELALKINKR